jgi:hypothetical protein
MPEIEIALLLRLLERGSVRESTRAEKVIERLERARWIERSSRAGEWVIAAGAALGVEARLQDLLPTWRADVDLLRRHQLDATDPAALRTLPALRALPTAAGFVHRKVWNAVSSAGSKVPSRIVTEATLTDDWAQRGRVNCPTVLNTPVGDVDLLQQTRLLGEFSIPERCWREASGFSGELPRLVLTVENLGALVDLSLPTRSMVLFSQGAAVHGSAAILRALPEAQRYHFGDLDNAGIESGFKLAELALRHPHFYIPSFAAEYLARATPTRQPWRRPPPAHPITDELVRRDAWLEQEVFLLDERLHAELEAIAVAGRREA